MKPPVTIQAKLSRLKPVPFDTGSHWSLRGEWRTPLMYVVSCQKLPVAVYFPPHEYWGDVGPVWFIAKDEFPGSPYALGTIIEGLKRAATARRKAKAEVLNVSLAKVRLAIERCHPAPSIFGASRLITSR